jgi:hypothetical protein
MGDGKFVVVKDRKLGYVDTTGKTIIEPQYADGGAFDNGRAFVFNGKKWLMINEQGKQVGALFFDDVQGQAEGIGRVVISGKVGFVDGTGKLIVSCKYDKAEDCYAGLIIAYARYKDVMGQTKIKGKAIDYGTTKDLPIVYNTKGAIVYKPQPDESVEITPTGKIVVSKTTTYPGFKSISRSKLLDNAGKIVIPYENNWYLEVKDYTTKITVTDGGYGVGMMDHSGNVLIKPNFKQIDWYIDYEGQQLAKVYFKNSNDLFYVDYNGKCVEYKGVKCP